jgi:hypothetical protein
MTEPTEKQAKNKKRLSRQISELEKESRELYQSGNYYTYKETDTEFILIIDGKREDSIFLTTENGTPERLAEIIKIELLIEQEGSSTRKKIKQLRKPFLEPYFYDLFEKEYRQKTHEHTPNSPLTKVLKDTLTHGVNLPSTKDAKIDIYHDRITNEYVITYTSKTNEGKIYIPDLEQITSKNGKDITARKVLLFILSQANKQNFNNVITFQLSELVERGIYENERTAIKGAKKILDKLLSIQIEWKTTKGRQMVSSQRSVLFTDNYISRRFCTITCKGHVLQYLSQYFMLTPQWIYKLSTKKALLLADLIYTSARQKQNQENIVKNGFYNISFKTINRELGNPEPEETQRHAQFIIDPILNAIDEVERISQEEESPIKLTPIYNENYKNGNDFLLGYLQIRLADVEIDYIKMLAKQRNKRTTQAIKKAEKIKLAAITRNV